MSNEGLTIQELKRRGYCEVHFVYKLSDVGECVLTVYLDKNEMPPRKWAQFNAFIKSLRFLPEAVLAPDTDALN
jgi:hypothetical protein